MDLTLPQRIYLISYDLDKHRFDSLSILYRGQLLRAAAVTDLTLAGLVRDVNGKVVRTSTDTPDDAFLAAVLADIPADKPRGRVGHLTQKITKAEPAVRQQLADLGVITVHSSKMLGLVPRNKIALNEPDQIRMLREQARNALLTDPATAATADMATAAIAAAGEIGTAFSLKEQLLHQTQKKALTRFFDATVPGVTKSIRQAVAASRAAQTN